MGSSNQKAQPGKSRLRQRLSTEADNLGNGNQLVGDVLLAGIGVGVDQLPVGAHLQLRIGGRKLCHGSHGEGDAKGCEALALTGVQLILTAVLLRVTVNFIGNSCAAVGQLESTVTQDIGGILGLAGTAVGSGHIVVNQHHLTIQGGKANLPLQAVCIGVLQVGQQLQVFQVRGDGGVHNRQRECALVVAASLLHTTV